MAEKLGPCPLCGGEGQPRPNNEVACDCGLYANFEIWNQLSALAESKRELLEALKAVMFSYHMSPVCQKGVVSLCHCRQCNKERAQAAIDKAEKGE